MKKHAIKSVNSQFALNKDELYTKLYTNSNALSYTQILGFPEFRIIFLL